MRPPGTEPGGRRPSHQRRPAGDRIQPAPRLPSSRRGRRMWRPDVPVLAGTQAGGRLWSKNRRHASVRPLFFGRLPRGPPPMIRLLASLSMLVLALPALAADTVKLAITGPFSGGSAPMGTSMRDGAKLAISEINAAGGIQAGSTKMKIEVIERDDEAKNERGALIAQELAAMPDLSGVIGSVNTGVVMAGDRHLQEKGYTKIITPAAGSASMTQWVGKADDLSIFRF